MTKTTLAAAALFALSSTLAFAQSTNAPGASTIGGEPNPTSNKAGTAGGSAMQGAPATTTGNSNRPSTNDASKSGSPAADNAEKFQNSPTPGSVNK